MLILSNHEEAIVSSKVVSGVVLTLIDTENKISGMLHSLFPYAEAYDDGDYDAGLFLDTGLRSFFGRAEHLGARLETAVLTAIGGAGIRFSETQCERGRQNLDALTTLLAERNLGLAKHEFGGYLPRTVILDPLAKTTSVLIEGRGEKTL